jgi:Flp pilus assembly protein CpaB
MEKYQELLTKRITHLIELISHHAVFAFILLFAALAGYLIIESASIIDQEPTAAQTQEAQDAIRNIQIDEKSLRVVNELNSRNISLESLFIDRDNPFEN